MYVLYEHKLFKMYYVLISVAWQHVLCIVLLLLIIIKNTIICILYINMNLNNMNNLKYINRINKACINIHFMTFSSCQTLDI